MITLIPSAPVHEVAEAFKAWLSFTKIPHRIDWHYANKRQAEVFSSYNGEK